MSKEVQLSNWIQPLAAFPIDARSLISSISNLELIDKAYVGLLVYVTDENKYITVTAVDGDDVITGYKYFGEGTSSIISVLKKGSAYISTGITSNTIYQGLVKSGNLPTVKVENKYFTPVFLSADVCRFTNSLEDAISTLLIEGSTWAYSETERSSIFYCEVLEEGNSYTSQLPIEEIKLLNSKGIEVVLLYEGKLYTLIYTDTEHTVFGTLILSTESENIGKVEGMTTIVMGASGNSCSVVDTPIKETLVAGLNILGSVQTEENKDTDYKYMLPIVINSGGYVYNGLNIIEVQEPGLYVVDKNMDAGFSSNKVATSGESTAVVTPTNPEVDPEIELDIAALKTDVNSLQAAIGNLGNIKILIDNNA